MKLGLYGINMGACLDPGVAARVARAAEGAGFESLWTAEHVVLPEPRTPESPVEARTPLLDPAVALAFLAGQTRTIRLATGIVILPQRNPVVLAKELASVDVLSGGRLIFGLGAGYIPKEFAACGVPFEERGARTDEAIAVLRDLWTSPKPHFEGRFFRYADVDAYPRPLQRPHPPIVVGGMSDAAFLRAVRSGNGWYGFALDPDATARCLDGLRRAAETTERPASLGKLEITVTPTPGRPSAVPYARYAELGVDRLVPIGLGADGDGLVRFVEETARAAASVRTTAC